MAGPLQRAEYSEATRLLAEAFTDDPFYQYLFPHRRHRLRATGAILGGLLRGASSTGLLTAARRKGALAGLTLSFAPGTYPLGAWANFRAVLYMLPRVGPRVTPLSALRYGLATDRLLHSLHPEEPHLYLSLLATGSRFRGLGVGSELIAAVLADGAARGLPVYVETTNPPNVAYYERFGFRTRRELRAPEGGPRIWAMLRPPGPERGSPEGAAGAPSRVSGNAAECLPMPTSIEVPDA